LADITALVLARFFKNPSLESRPPFGIYHVAGSGAASRLEWAEHILRLDPDQEEQIVQNIEPAVSSEFPSPAKRPPFSALDCSLFENTFDLIVPDWKTLLQKALYTES
jgi:dTDP-4-dehydrorhamnose reductase